MDDEKRRKVLAISGDPTNLATLEEHLQKTGLIPILQSDPEAGMESAFREQPDIILLDVVMPGINGYEVCRRLKADARTLAIPIIFVLARDEAGKIDSGLELGAADYIFKPFQAGELKARIGTVCRMIALQERLAAQADTDELTGLYNRRKLLDHLEHEVLHVRSRIGCLSLLLFDLDNFKSVNDTYGYLGGDAILRQFAQIISENIYPLDLAARYGGEEFVVVMPDTNRQNALKAAQRLRSKVKSHVWETSAEPLALTTCIGVSTMEVQDSLTSEDLIRQADAALNYAKRQGRDQVVHWSDVDTENEIPPQDVSGLQGRLTHMVQQLRQQTLGSISALVRAIEAKDRYVTHHSDNVQAYAQAIAYEFGLSEEFMEKLIAAAQLHDLGKIGIPDQILQKKGPLTKEERIIIQQHPLVSVRILEPLPVFEGELQIIRHHHERFDGKGYPDGLAGKEIPFGARILALADSFDAITSDRVYRKARIGAPAKNEIVRCSGSQFDPEVVEAFLAAWEKHAEQWPLAAVLST